MERIVYLLGAGFSAPLGLPVMANFFSRSKDMLLNEPEKYVHFREIFKMVDGMAKAKNYYSANLFNIEEILSILETEMSIGKADHRQSFTRYLSDVITHYTPSEKDFPKELYLYTQLLSEPYKNFVAHLIANRIRYSPLTQHGLPTIHVTFERDETPTSEYAILSFNYDRVLENSLNALYGRNIQTLKFGTKATPGTVPLAKLHGSVGDEIIVAPTWNKTVSPHIKDAWLTAYEVLSQATQLRIIGYSLPISDAYVRYLLKAAILPSEHLRNIDIVLKENNFDTETVARYREFITYENARVVINGTENYLANLLPANTIQGSRELNALENGHERHFQTSGSRLWR